MVTIPNASGGGIRWRGQRTVSVAAQTAAQARALEAPAAREPAARRQEATTATEAASRSRRSEIPEDIAEAAWPRRPGCAADSRGGGAGRGPAHSRRVVGRVSQAHGAEIQVSRTNTLLGMAACVALLTACTSAREVQYIEVPLARGGSGDSAAATAERGNPGVRFRPAGWRQRTGNEQAVRLPGDSPRRGALHAVSPQEHPRNHRLLGRCERAAGLQPGRGRHHFRAN